MRPLSPLKRRYVGWFGRSFVMLRQCGVGSRKADAERVAAVLQRRRPAALASALSRVQSAASLSRTDASR